MTVDDCRMILGDCLDVLPTLEAGPVDAVVCDPPYALGEPRSGGNYYHRPRTGEEKAARRGGFMGKAWDDDVAFRPETWTAALRVLKPGGYLLAFGGTRTYHRLACAVEDAGFEVRDCLMWVYGSGFPKGRGCLKPAWEPVLLARRPGPRVLPLNVDGCRVGTPTNKRSAGARRYISGGKQPGANGGELHDAPHDGKGRWPANVAHDGLPEVLEAFAAFGQRSGPRKAARRPGDGNGYHGMRTTDEERPAVTDSGTAARFFANLPPDEEELVICHVKAIMAAWTPSSASTAGGNSSLPSEHVVSALALAVATASGGALQLAPNCQGLTTNVTPNESRRLAESVIAATLSIARRSSPALPVGKPTPPNGRVSGAGRTGQSGTTTITISHWKCDGSASPATFAITSDSSVAGELGSASRFSYCAKASKRERGDGNTHPTVKPLSLMRWLVRLVTFPGQLVLDPFAGSGTTGVACLAEGRRFLGVEQDPAYHAIACRRIAAATNVVSEPVGVA